MDLMHSSLKKWISKMIVFIILTLLFNKGNSILQHGACRRVPWVLFSSIQKMHFTRKIISFLFILLIHRLYLIIFIQSIRLSSHIYLLQLIIIGLLPINIIRCRSTFTALVDTSEMDQTRTWIACRHILFILLWLGQIR